MWERVLEVVCAPTPWEVMQGLWGLQPRHAIQGGLFPLE